MLIFNVLLLLILDIRSCYSQIGLTSYLKCQEYSKGDGKSPIISFDIVGGTLAREGEFPHMAGLGYGSPDNWWWYCGGSLISERFILTAAHCLFHKKHGEVKIVRLGTTNLAKPGSFYKDYNIAQKIRHPHYERKIHDIALLRLSTNVTFSRYIKPACLQIHKNFDTSFLTAIGFGADVYGGLPKNILYKVGLVIYDEYRCRLNFPSKRDFPRGFETEYLICAGGRLDKSEDTCEGDSGGPLQILKRQYHIVGVTIAGKNCGISYVPAIYARVSSYIGWIEKTTWMDNYEN